MASFGKVKPMPSPSRRETMRRKASDNRYLHKDFHGALSLGLEYLERHYGDEAVRDYLRQFVTSFHGPLRAAIRDRGLPALKEYLEGIYRLEGGNIRTTLTED